MAGEDLNPDPDKSKGEGEPKMVPLAALEDVRGKWQASEKRAAQLEGQVQGLSAVKTEPKVDPPKQLSAADLRQAVDEGKLTEDEAEAIKNQQIEKRVTAKVTEEVETRLARDNLSERVSTDIGRYKQAIPDLADLDSAAFKKVQAEFTYLTRQRYEANDPRTELIAIRAAFGDIDNLQKIKPGTRETHQETGGRQESGTDIADGAPKDMPADTKRYYQDQINQGVVVDWAAAKAEYGYKPKHAPRARSA
jgi:hypothetical protein